jgi:CPA1 family monovalent cation:H+ antiporter
LSIPLTAASGAPLPRRHLMMAIATAVIVVSLIVQGLTLEPLARLDELAVGDYGADDVIDRARASLQVRIVHGRTRQQLQHSLDLEAARLSEPR